MPVLVPKPHNISAGCTSSNSSPIKTSACSPLSKPSYIEICGANVHGCIRHDTLHTARYLANRVVSSARKTREYSCLDGRVLGNSASVKILGDCKFLIAGSVSISSKCVGSRCNTHFYWRVGSKCRHSHFNVFKSRVQM